MTIDDNCNEDKPATDMHDPCWIVAAMREVERVVGRYFPEALDPLKAALAVVVVGCLSDNAQPTTLMLVGAPGAGKTLPLSWMFPPEEKTGHVLTKYLYRSDKFTAASFVSHRADLSEEQLADKVDLLPRIKGKTLLTKELAPMFRGKREELMERFSVLASVLDGRGYISDSGAQGRRGYQGTYNFQWIGATTPLSKEALEVMGQVGPRILFYKVDRPPKTIKEMEAFLAKGSASSQRDCEAAVRAFLRTLYQVHPVESVAIRDIAIAQPQLRLLALLAHVAAALRAPERKSEEEDPGTEHPERVGLILKNIAIGSALAHGRSAVNDYDLAQIGHIALSSGVPGRASVFRAAIQIGRNATAREIEEYTGLSRPTVLKYMEELDSVCGLGEFTEGKPATLTIYRDFRELRHVLRLSRTTL